MRTFILTLVVILASIAAFGWATEGFQVVTSESARRLAVARDPVMLPSARLTLESGEARPLRSLLKEGGRTTLVTFIYTRCTTVCIGISSEFRRLQQRILNENLADQVNLLSISFDPRHDTPQVLTHYAHWMSADRAIWRFASVRDEGQLQELLNAFGIVVLPLKEGGYSHNAAFHVVNSTGELTAIVDLSQPDMALARALELSR